MTSQNYEYIDSHVLGSCPASFVARGKRNNEKDFHLTEFLIIALVGCVSQIGQEHHWVFWCVVPWKFRTDKGAWSPKLDYSNGPYLQNVLKSCRTSQNTAETRDSRNTHTIRPSLSDYVLYIYYLWREPIFTCSRHIYSPSYLSIWKFQNYVKHIPPQESSSAIMTHQELSGEPKTTPKHCHQTGNWTILPTV